MRTLALLTAVYFLPLWIDPVSAQPTPPKTGDTKTGETKTESPSWPTEIGGRPFKDWMEDLKHPDPSIRERAIRVVPNFGPISRKAVPLLVARTRDWDASPRVRAVQSFVFVEIEDDDVPKVIEALGRRLIDDSQTMVRYCAALSLSRFDPEDGKPALPYLVKGVEDPSSWEVRRACLAVLVPYAIDEKKGPDPGAVLALMRVVSSDPALLVKQEAAVGLALMGKPADEKLAAALEKKFQMLAADKKSDKSIAVWANVGLIGMGKAGAKEFDAHLEPLLKAIRSSDLTLRAHGLRAVATLGDKAKAAIPDLLELLGDKDPDAAIGACLALGRMGRINERQLAGLTALSQKKEALEPVKAAAKAALEMINGKKKEDPKP